MYKNSDKKANPLVLILVCLGLGIGIIISGFVKTSSDALDLNEAFNYGIGKDNSYEGDIKYCSQCVFEYSYRLYYIIPMGTEYYYIAVSDDESSAVVLRADKDFGDSFDKDTSTAFSTVHIKGKVSSMPSEVRSRFTEIKNEMHLDQPNFERYCIDLLSDRNSRLRIISGIGFLIADVFLAWFFIKTKSRFEEYNLKHSFSNYSKSEKVISLTGFIISLASLLLFIYSLV